MELNRTHAPLPWQIKKAEPFRNRANDARQLAFHNSPAWRKCSANYRYSHPFCEACESLGLKPTPFAALTDHIIPIEAGGDHWDERNLMALCDYHHNRKSGMESRLKSLGKSLPLESGRLAPVDRLEIIRKITTEKA